MITTEGKLHIKRYMAEYVNSIAGSIVFGIGSTAESLSDTALQLEVDSSPINLVTYDFINDQIVYKAEIPEEYEGKIYEAGIYSLEADPTNAAYASRLITTFDSVTENWVTSADVDAIFTTANTRVGLDSLAFTPAASTSTNYYLNEIELDLSGYSAADQFVFAYNVGNANTTQIQIRFYTDSTNYYWTNLGVQTAGYKFVTVNKGNFSVTGTPNWEIITKIMVAVTSGAGGASDVSMDAVRINDVDSAITDYVLVSRKVLPSPITKVAGMAQDFEYRVDLTV